MAVQVESTGEQIVRAMVGHRFGSGLSVAEIAAAAELGQSTVRVWMPRLRAEGLVRETLYRGIWTTTGKAEQQFRQ